MLVAFVCYRLVSAALSALAISVLLLPIRFHGAWNIDGQTRN